MALQYLTKVKSRAALKKSCPQGAIIAEVQDVLEQMQAIRHVSASFETGEVGTLKLYFPYAVTIKKIRFQVSKTLAGTDAGTIDVKDSAGTSIGSQVSIAASTAQGNEPTAITPTSPGKAIAAADYVQIISAKTTAGGRCNVYLEYVLGL